MASVAQAQFERRYIVSEVGGAGWTQLLLATHRSIQVPSGSVSTSACRHDGWSSRVQEDRRTVAAPNVLADLATDAQLWMKWCKPCAQYTVVHLQNRRSSIHFRRAMCSKRSLDITGPHPRSRDGNEYILTVMDSFSKFAEAIPFGLTQQPLWLDAG